MAANTLKCSHLMPLYFKGLTEADHCSVGSCALFLLPIAIPRVVTLAVIAVVWRRCSGRYRSNADSVHCGRFDLGSRDCDVRGGHH